MRAEPLAGANAGANEIAAALKKNEKLTDLRMDDNYIGDAGARALDKKQQSNVYSKDDKDCRKMTQILSGARMYQQSSPTTPEPYTRWRRRPPSLLSDERRICAGARQLGSGVASLQPARCAGAATRRRLLDAREKRDLALRSSSGCAIVVVEAVICSLALLCDSPVSHGTPSGKTEKREPKLLSLTNWSGARTATPRGACSPPSRKIVMTCISGAQDLRPRQRLSLRRSRRYATRPRD